jgi:hypothetical protein
MRENFFRNYRIRLISSLWKKLSFVILVGLSLNPTIVMAHGGRTSNLGCHNQNKDATYHCHKGPYAGKRFESKAAFESFLLGRGSETVQTQQYQREDYLPRWGDQDRDCMNTRHELLMAESSIPVTLSSNGCDVVQGEWLDKATGQVFTDPSDIDVDHHVPLSEVHRSGGAAWSVPQKRSYANDLLNPHVLIIMDDETNSAKGDKDPSQWLPPNRSYHCEYVVNWVRVKQAYGLTYDRQEIAAIEKVLGFSIEKLSSYNSISCVD